MSYFWLTNNFFTRALEGAAAGSYPEELLLAAPAGLPSWDDVRVRYDYYKKRGYLRGKFYRDIPCDNIRYSGSVCLAGQDHLNWLLNHVSYTFRVQTAKQRSNQPHKLRNCIILLPNQLLTSMHVNVNLLNIKQDFAVYNYSLSSSIVLTVSYYYYGYTYLFCQPCV